MRKLNQKKIRWIIREIERGEMSVYKITKLQKISPQWARSLYRRYKRTRIYPYCKRPGRKLKPLSKHDEKEILKMKKMHPLSGAYTLEKLLDQTGLHIPHNRIHKVLKDKGLAKDEPKKQRRRSWLRYERKHSNSMWHTDLFEKGENGKDMVLFEDDAARFMTGGGTLERPTAGRCKNFMIDAVNNFGKPKQLMSDRGIQFTSSPREGCEKPRPNIFQKYLQHQDITHIKARIKHPQSNGKIERAGGTIRKLIRHFGTLEKALRYYNFERPHWSLNLDECETPFQALIHKMRPKDRRPFVNKYKELVVKYAPKYIKTKGKTKK